MWDYTGISRSFKVKGLGFRDEGSGFIDLGLGFGCSLYRQPLEGSWA